MRLAMPAHLDHDDVRDHFIRERQPLRIRHAIEPGCGLDVRRHRVGHPALEVADAAADFNGQAGPASGGDAVVESS
jgi:hypothetical protein